MTATPTPAFSRNPAGAPDDIRPISLAEIWRVMRDSSRLILLVTGVIAAATGVFGLLKPLTYTSELTFFPQPRGGESLGGGLAAQLGLSALQGDPTQSPQFYTDLVQTRPILEAVVRQKFQFMSDTGKFSGSLIQLYAHPDHSAARQLDEAVRALTSMVDATVSTRSGLVVLRVTSIDPTLSREIAAAMLAQIQDFNLAKRQSQARAERNFVEQQLNGAEAELRADEDRLAAFLVSNRAAGAPTLALQRDRLERAISQQQGVVSGLAQAFEKAKIDEVRDTPVLTVVEPPEAPVEHDPRRIVARVITALFGGLALGIVIALLRSYMAEAKARSEGDATASRAEYATALHA